MSVMRWMLTYQDVRRNMCEAERIYANDKVSARRIEEENEKKIKEGYSKERRSEKLSCVQMDAGSNIQQRNRSTNTREQRAKIAGVGIGTVARYNKVKNLKDIITWESMIMVKSHLRGWEIYFDGKDWRYIDNGKLADDSRPCKRCGRMPTKKGYDACLGYIEGAKSACCGHGIGNPILLE